MTTPSLYQQSGISIAAWEPLIDMSIPSYDPRGSVVSDVLADLAVQYQHEILADGGWWSATLSLALNLTSAEEWFSQGINRHIEVYNPAGVVIWAGFVNQVSLSAGPLQAIRGPLMDVANRDSVVYTPILDATTTPPTEGSETTTAIQDDTASQDLYGVLEDVVSGGNLLDDGNTNDAIQLRDAYLEENKEPQTSEQLSLSEGREVTLTLDLLGYVHRLRRWVYQDTTTTTVQLDDQIQNIIAADPNGMFSTDYSKIDSNASLTSRYTDDNVLAWDKLQKLVSIGDASYNRYTLGVYDQQRIAYNIVPTSVAYQHAIQSAGMQIETYGSGAYLDSWDVLPARWLFLYDFLPSLGPPGTLGTDPRYLFIESVQYTAPQALSLSGQKVYSLPQMIERLAT